VRPGRVCREHRGDVEDTEPADDHLAAHHDGARGRHRQRHERARRLEDERARSGETHDAELRGAEGDPFILVGERELEAEHAVFADAAGSPVERERPERMAGLRADHEVPLAHELDERAAEAAEGLAERGAALLALQDLGVERARHRADALESGGEGDRDRGARDDDAARVQAYGAVAGRDERRGPGEVGGRRRGKHAGSRDGAGGRRHEPPRGPRERRLLDRGEPLGRGEAQAHGRELGARGRGAGRRRAHDERLSTGWRLGGRRRRGDRPPRRRRDGREHRGRGRVARARCAHRRRRRGRSRERRRRRWTVPGRWGMGEDRVGARGGWGASRSGWGRGVGSLGELRAGLERGGSVLPWGRGRGARRVELVGLRRFRGRREVVEPARRRPRPLRRGRSRGGRGGPVRRALSCGELLHDAAGEVPVPALFEGRLGLP
jgi:hypothetical protein